MFTIPPLLDDQLSLESLHKRVQQIVDFVNGRTSIVDFLGFQYKGIFNAGVPVTIAHNLKSTPAGFLVIYKEVNGNLIAIAGSFTNNSVQLQADVTGTYTVIILR
jgi:hypothetical protein